VSIWAIYVRGPYDFRLRVFGRLPQMAVYADFPATLKRPRRREGGICKLGRGRPLNAPPPWVMLPLCSARDGA